LKRIAKKTATGYSAFFAALAGSVRGNLVVASIVPFLPRGAFDDATIKVMGGAFAAACKARHRAGQPPVGHEVIARRIVEAARAGECDLKRLTEAALVARPKNKRD
jgi:hypothetical protein